MRVPYWGVLLLLLCIASFQLANAKKIQPRRIYKRNPTTPPSSSSFGTNSVNMTPIPTVDNTATTTNAAAATTSAQATSTAQSTTEAASMAATATSESTVTASTAAAAGGTQSTTTYATTTSEASTTQVASTTTFADASTTAAVAGPTATNQLSATTTQSTATTAASLSTTIAQSTSTTTTAASTTARASELASTTSFSSTTATATSTNSGLPSDSSASATASIGVTTFGAASGGGSTTGPTIPPSTCAVGSACCQFDAPVPNSFCVGPAYLYNNDLVASGLEATIREPFSVYGSTLLTGSVIQISSPTTINGNFSIDATSVLSLTQVPGLTRPLLTIRGSASFAGTISFTLDRKTPLLAPMVRVLDDATVSGFVVATVGMAYPTDVPLLAADTVIADDPEGDGTTFDMIVVFSDRPTSHRKKRSDPPQVIVCLNATQSLSVPLASTPVTVSKRYAGNECDDLQAPAQQSGTSLSVLVSIKDTCGSKGLSKAAIGGIVAGAAAFVIIVVILGILALKKGYFGRLFRFKEKNDNLVI